MRKFSKIVLLLSSISILYMPINADASRQRSTGGASKGAAEAAMGNIQCPAFDQATLDAIKKSNLDSEASKVYNTMNSPASKYEESMRAAKQSVTQPVEVNINGARWKIGLDNWVVANGKSAMIQSFNLPGTLKNQSTSEGKLRCTYNFKANLAGGSMQIPFEISLWRDAANK